MLTIWTALLPAELERQPLAQSTVVVIDALRATSTIVTALAHGAKAVVPVREVAQARKLRKPGWVLAGEREGLPPKGFDRGNSPLEFIEETKGKTVVLTTSNGTATLTACYGAKNVFIASYLNLLAVVNALKKEKTTVGLVCAGDQGVVSLEDTVCAGMIAACLAARQKFEVRINDGTAMAVSVAGAFPKVLPMLKNSVHGLDLIEIGLEKDLEFIAGINKFDIVPQMRNGIIYASSPRRH
jgi:2-phosphosulfolactate phosphatase